MLVVLGLGCDRGPAVQAKSQRPPPAVPAKPGAEYTPSEAEVVETGDRASDDAATILVTDLDTPESVLHDTDLDVYLVSNVAGEPMEKDDNGFISKVSPEGKMLARKWIDGRKGDVSLDAPKGMAIAGDEIWIADIDRLRRFDRKTGAPKGELVIEGALFLADVVADEDGVIYVSDMGNSPETGAIHRVANGRAKVLARGEALHGPNGLAIDSAGLWAVTQRGQELMRIGDDGKPADVTKLPAGKLDGLVITDDGRFFVSSWDAGAIFAGAPGGTFTTLFEGIATPADIGWDARRKRVLVPRFDADVVELRPVTESADKHAAR